MTAPWLEHLRAIVRKYIDPQRYEWKPAVDPVPRYVQLDEVYGDPKPRWVNGRGFCDAGWESRHCLVVSASRIVGYHRRLYMHKLVATHFREAMRRAVEACPEYSFEKIGCFNPRKMRFDADAPWSTHTWAIAFDLNDGKNRAFQRKAIDPMPFDVGWDRFSDLPQGVVAAFEGVGFTWGGRWGNGKRGGYCDPMHFQLAR